MEHHALRWFTCIAAALLLAGCSARHTVKGHYRSEPETSSFVPCGLHDAWWLVPSTDFEEQYRRLKETSSASASDRRGPTVFVHMDIMLRGPGDYGETGRYRHECRVLEVHEMRLPSRDDCR